MMVARDASFFHLRADLPISGLGLGVPRLLSALENPFREWA